MFPPLSLFMSFLYIGQKTGSEEYNVHVTSRPRKILDNLDIWR
jgi:hypothetical protein